MREPAAFTLPSVDGVVRAANDAVAAYGRKLVVSTVREILTKARSGKKSVTVEEVVAQAGALLEAKARLKLAPVFNLTGTVLHTNLGRALLAEAAIEAAVNAMRNPVALELDLGEGRRGDRDDLIGGLLRELTGAEDATVVNNNAAAVLLVLNTFARGREAIVSRGELIEIGGAFRMPEIMSRAGAKLIEVGTTNRTHLKDYAAAFGKKSGLVLKVHTSNYRIQGFTKEVGIRELSELARKSGVPLVSDLGSGTLIDLASLGLVHEPTVKEVVNEGADLVTFSGDKLLGGPQVGFVVGRKDLIAKVKKNPMKRALRIDKIRLAALEVTLRLYQASDKLLSELPTLRLLARPQHEICALCERILPAAARQFGECFDVAVSNTTSQIGSGALPTESIASAALIVRPRAAKGGGRALAALSKVLRGLPVPVIGRIENNALTLDLRCLEDEAAFIANLATLKGMQASSE